MSAHEQVVKPPVPFYLGGIPKGFKLRPMGTNVHLGADYPAWLADGFKHEIECFCMKWTDIRIQSLTFNGDIIFDYRLWPEPPELKPITVKVRKPNIPEWKEKA